MRSRRRTVRSEDDRFIIVRPCPGNQHEVWNKARQKWQWFYDGSCPVFLTMAGAGRHADLMARRGWIEREDVICYRESYFWQHIQGTPIIGHRRVATVSRRAAA